MKKLFIIITFVSLFLSINAYSLDLKKGHSIKDEWGNNLYWLPYQKKYVSCNEFVESGHSLDFNGLSGVKPVCEPWIYPVIDTSGLEGVIKLSDGENVEETTNKPKDVKGKKLFCFWNNESISGFGIEFNRNNKVKLRAIDDDNEKLFTINGKYKALSNKIIIEYKNLDNSDTDLTINRKTLKINGASRSSCKAIKKSSSIEAKLKLALDKLISKKSSENKF